MGRGLLLEPRGYGTALENTIALSQSCLQIEAQLAATTILVNSFYNQSCELAALKSNASSTLRRCIANYSEIHMVNKLFSLFEWACPSIS
jgi:hypothetical protein